MCTLLVEEEKKKINNENKTQIFNKMSCTDQSTE